ncbi:MAG: FecR family protein [Leptospiraceae bacterium]|nr:FecR family protein [Leptospiraceae bacterium]
MNEWNEREQKLYDAIFEKKQNEFSTQVNSLQKIFSKKIESDREFPDFELLIKEQGNKNRTKTMNKKLISILGAAAIFLIGVAIAVFTSGEKTQVAAISKEAKLTFISGNVRIKTSTGQEVTSPKVNMLVAMNDTIITSNKATAEVSFGDGNSLRIKSNTEVVLRKMIYGETASEEVYLKQGVLVAEVKKKKQDDSFNVMTPTVIAGVRGTRFQVSFDRNAKITTEVTVAEGSVGITKHNNEVPETKEPIEILDAQDQAQETGVRGPISVNRKLTVPKVEEIFNGTNDLDEKQLAKLHGKSEIEKIILTDKSVIRGFITNMTDSAFTVETLDGVRIIERNKVESSESEPIR